MSERLKDYLKSLPRFALEMFLFHSFILIYLILLTDNWSIFKTPRELFPILWGYLLSLVFVGILEVLP